MKFKLSILTALAFTHLVGAQELYPPDTIVAQLGDASLTLRDVDAMAFQLPDEVRAGVFDSPERIGDSLETMLVRRAMVAPLLATPPDYIDLPELKRKIRRKTLISHALQNAVASQPTPDFRARAESYYDANPDQFTLPATVSVRHVLISTDGRTPAAAFRLASRLRGELAAGTLSFDEAVIQYSDDPARNQNQGRYPRMAPGKMVPSFEAAAFSLPTPGAISEPVRSEYGYHVILLEEKHPRQRQPREAAVQQLASRYFQEHLKTRRDSYLAMMGPDAETKLLQMAEAEGLERSETFGARFQLQLEEAVLRAYRQHYLATNLVGDYEALAREYYLTHREEFERPAAISAVQIEVSKTDSDIADWATMNWLREMAGSALGAQVVVAFTPDPARAEQVVYLENDPQTARAARLASSLKQPGDCSEPRELSASYLVVCLIRKHPTLIKSFIEIQDVLTARLRNKQETQLWTLHVNEFHQLPFQADPQVVASLRTRYAPGGYAG